MTTIEWTEKTWNPIVGCSVVSPGCTNCYAMKMANRLSFNLSTPQYHGTIKGSSGGPVWTGKVALAENALLEPLKRKKPTTYFVNSMGDLFHDNIPVEWIDQVFAVMALCPQHTFQVLTKRSKRMREYCNYSQVAQCIWRAVGKSDFGNPFNVDVVALLTNWPLSNVWLGVSAEDQTRANERVPDLLRTQAAIRFVSAEPLLGPVDFTCINYDNTVMINALKGESGWPVFYVVGGPSLDQIIVGGESGNSARPMHPDWARKIRDDCQATGTNFFFKQWGSYGPIDAPMVRDYEAGTLINNHGSIICGRGPGITPDEIKKLGKKSAGRLLDGREWNEVPG